MKTPDGRTCEIRFGSDRITQSTKFRGKSYDELMRMQNLDENLLRNYHEGDIHRVPFMSLYAKQYFDCKGATVAEYQVVCNCFSNVTKTKMIWSRYAIPFEFFVYKKSSERIWREKLSPFQEWIMDNRARFRTQNNIRLAVDIINDDVFPKSDILQELLSYLQWLEADYCFINFFVIIYGTYEQEVFGRNTINDIVRCSECNNICDTLTVTQNFIKVCGKCSESVYVHGCKCRMCHMCWYQKGKCDIHWSPFCTCSDDDCEPEQKKIKED